MAEFRGNGTYFVYPELDKNFNINVKDVLNKL